MRQWYKNHDNNTKHPREIFNPSPHLPQKNPQTVRICDFFYVDFLSL
jgi:hypothetical protein